MQKKLALIFGGEGAERRISELSASNVIEKIRGKLDFITVGISPSGNWFLFYGNSEEIESGEWINSDKQTEVYPARFDGKSGFYTKNSELIEIDLAFPILHGDFGEDGIIQSALTIAGKACGKDIAMKKATEIVFAVSKPIYYIKSLFRRKGKK